MKVVLLENVEHLGIVGDIKEVASGYARNFLLPKMLVVKVGDPKAKSLLKDISKKRQVIKAEVKKIQKKADSLEGKTVEFNVKANEKGKLFAAITAADIAKKLELDNIKIQTAPIKDAGTHKAKIYFEHNVNANIEVIVEINDTKKKQKVNK